MMMFLFRVYVTCFYHCSFRYYRISKNFIEIWQGVVTFLFFPLLEITAGKGWVNWDQPSLEQCCL